MAHQTATDLLVLHGIRLRGFADADAIAETTGVAPDLIAEPLGAAAVDGLVVRRQGRISGWTLTSGGREEHERRLRADVTEASCDDVLEDAYGGFLQVNDRFKEVCTAWQLEGRPERCVDELGEIHAVAVEVTGRLAASMLRYTPYRRRLDSAIDRLRAGDGDALTKPLSGSYHDVWMELHQDLLLTLGRERTPADGA